MENKETLASALCKAQSEFTPAAQSGYNTRFPNKYYSTMTDLINASRPALTKYGLSVLQYPSLFEGIHVVITKIKFGLEEEVSMSPINLQDNTDQQKFGSAMTYITRYVYKNMLGIVAADEDDDGNATVPAMKESAPSDAISDKQLAMLKALLKSQPNRESALLLHYKIDDLSKLSWKHMNEVVAALKPKGE